jgi:hypothetical protein
VQARFNAELQQTMSRTVWASGCRSYGQTETGKVVTQWPNPSGLYRRSSDGPRQLARLLTLEVGDRP